jgi:hypothetical protein
MYCKIRCDGYYSTPSILVLDVVLASAEIESKEVVLGPSEELDAAAPRASAPAPRVNSPAVDLVSPAAR